MALKLNLKKDELISVAVEMGLVIPSKAKIINLKELIGSSAVYKNDIEFVRSLAENALEKSKQEAEKNGVESKQMGEKEGRRLALGGKRETRRMFSWPKPKQIVFCRNCFCLRPNNSLIHFSRDKTKNPTPTSNLNLDAPTFVPGQIEGSVEANSQSQFVATGACAEKLQLKMEKINTVVSCVNDASMVVKNCVKTSVANKAKTFESELMLLVVNKITDLIPNKVIDVDVNVSEFVPLADDKFDITDRIDMLLGAEIFYELLKPGQFYCDNLHLV
ncbi:integrase catalytic domain-containing protein [Trichonephila clavipes]|nr:integrase catalytic domain-containing protein [Trichonephila clavipes]